MRPLPAKAGQRAAAGVTLAIVVAFGGAVGLAAIGDARPSPTGTGVASSPPVEVPETAGRRSLPAAGGGAPSALISSLADGGAIRQGVIALPGCNLTLQLGGRQPRRIRQCPHLIPYHTGQPLIVRPGEALRFEVPGWRLQVAGHGTVVAPSRTGLQTVEVQTCLSRDDDWICATWYATVEVRA